MTNIIVREVRARSKWEAWQGRRCLLTLKRTGIQGRGPVYEFTAGGFPVSEFDHDQVAAALELLKAVVEPQPLGGPYMDTILMKRTEVNNV